MQGYIKLASQGRFDEALELIRRENPFPAVCGRVCPRFCEEACTRGDVDAPVAIDEVKKFLAQRELDPATRVKPKMLNTTGKPYTNKIAVIGAGPAGLSCAYYLALQGYPVTVFEKLKNLGGMLTMGIPSFRLEKDVVKAEIEITDRDNGGILVNLSGPGMGAVIGRRGETLDAIQHLTNYAVNRGSDKRCHISVDAENYRSKREESLVHLAEKMAAKVVKYKRSMALEPMNSYERHVIHTALQNFEGVSTSSTGTEPNRRVVVSYERPNKQDDTRPKSREWS